MMHTSPSPSPSPPDWSPCPQGEVHALVSTLRSHRAHVARRRWAAVVTSCVLVVGGGWFVARQWPNTVEELADVSCREVRMQANRYLAGTLSPEVMARIDRHLTRCPGCRKAIDNGSSEPSARSGQAPFETLSGQWRRREDLVAHTVPLIASATTR